MALTRALLERPGCGSVTVTSRRIGPSVALHDLAAAHPQRLRRQSLDVADESSVARAAEAIRAESPRLHLLINATGLLHQGPLRPERRLEEVSNEHLHRSFAVNAFGPILLARHFVPQLTHAEPAVFASLSARVGSIADNRLGGWYAYRAAKAAQNQFLRTLAVEMTRRAPRLRVLALHPGTVDTGLSRPFQAAVAPAKLFSPDRAAAQLLDVIEQSEGSGRFLAWDGTEIPW